MDAPAGAVACRSPTIAGILGVFQDFGAKAGGDGRIRNVRPTCPRGNMRGQIFRRDARRFIQRFLRQKSEISVFSRNGVASVTPFLFR